MVCEKTPFECSLMFTWTCCSVLAGRCGSMATGRTAWVSQLQRRAETCSGGRGGAETSAGGAADSHGGAAAGRRQHWVCVLHLGTKEERKGREIQSCNRTHMLLLLSIKIKKVKHYEKIWFFFWRNTHISSSHRAKFRNEKIFTLLCAKKSKSVFSKMCF